MQGGAPLESIVPVTTFDDGGVVAAAPSGFAVVELLPQALAKAAARNAASNAVEGGGFVSFALRFICRPLWQLMVADAATSQRFVFVDTL